MPHPLLRALGNLHQLRRDFSAPAVAQSRRLLVTLGRETPRSARHLVALHDELLFLVAFPKSGSLTTAARQLLRRTPQLVARLPPAQQRRLADSGIAGTRTTHTFMFGAARWLASHGSARIVSQGTTDWARAESLIRQLMLPSEADAFDDGGLSTEAWVTQASRHAGGSLRWLTSVTTPATEQLWDDAELRVEWELGTSSYATSLLRAPAPPQRSRAPFRSLPPGQPAPRARPPRVRRLQGTEAQAWIAASQGALIARCREVAPTLYANPHDTWLADLGEGTAACVIGADPGHRLALEANYGYVLFSCGIPVGYGGVTPFANQANTGINVFDAFRHSEAPWLFAQCLRAFHELLGIAHFVVNPYQFGAGNDEALASGAWWFYERLGFRPSDPSAQALAARERERRRDRPGYRSPASVLRRLAHHDLVLTVGAPGLPPVAESLLARSGLVASRVMAHLTPADRPGWLAARAAWWKRSLTGEPTPPTPVELAGFRHLGPLIEGIGSHVRRWGAAERQQLWVMVAAKGGASEVRFARHAAGHGPFWHALADVASA